MRLVAAAVIASLAVISAPGMAAADDGSSVTSDTNNVAVKAWKSRSKASDSSSRTPKSKSGASRSTSIRATSDKAPSPYDTQIAAYKQYLTARGAWDSCVAAGAGACQRPADVALPQAPEPVAQGQGQPDGPRATPQISPEQAAYAAVARLRLTPPKPMIGPSPEINEWKMAAVGYPYWLWADGNLDPAPVSTTVQDLTVRLDARLHSTTFDMGDGTELTCTDLSARWSPAVEPGAASPSCGHTYTKPSLPQGDYTITAYSTWAVDWSVNGVGGTIPLYQQASTTVPVGELQVLTH